MILSLVKIAPRPGRQQDVLDILQSVRGPVVAASGCLECSIYVEHDDERTIVYLEKWQSSAEMSNHIRSDLYTRVLRSLELSTRQPEIRFYEISATRGMELIESIRSSSADVP